VIPQELSQNGERSSKNMTGSSMDLNVIRCDDYTNEFRNGQDKVTLDQSPLTNDGNENYTF